VERRMDGLRRGDVMVYAHPSLDGRIIEIRRHPVAAGGFVSIYTDISERKWAEERLQAAYDVITGSIQYATRIQRSVLPPQSYLAEDLVDHFVIWPPRDLVGGDIYWYRRIATGFLIILTDTIGHDVPGAFMSLISTGALDRTLRATPDGSPSQILHDINQGVKRTLRQDRDEGESDDGLELGVCLIEPGDDRLTFAGARFSLFHAKGDVIEEIKGDKSGIGYRRVPGDQTFTDHVVDRLEGRTFYMSSDGLIDQVGGEKGRMFGKKRFVTLLDSLRGQPMSERCDPRFLGRVSGGSNSARRCLGHRVRRPLRTLFKRPGLARSCFTTISASGHFRRRRAAVGEGRIHDQRRQG
jgi:hypothetical protein